MADVAELEKLVEGQQKQIAALLEGQQAQNQCYEALRNDLPVAICQINETLLEKATAAAKKALNNILARSSALSDHWTPKKRKGGCAETVRSMNENFRKLEDGICPKLLVNNCNNRNMHMKYMSNLKENMNRYLAIGESNKEYDSKVKISQDWEEISKTISSMVTKESLRERSLDYDAISQNALAQAIQEIDGKLRLIGGEVEKNQR
ncbi:hypothetical protein BDK51DRAFT_25569 [Blyttiomyces helicus]|uniref:Uncharacterized protein n=1 Tax=Blyttiomyces helicus TaxID=388810 RepID=A0A4P9WF87_9FUNG|nr:hypothetical protein BDK51DRAFT_25569 [Blyttiomyces helicus]|eukprot:RKO89680.1 hypothetical protein BDK51DRAFT_25569 [Blyttiomyces helicus]